jgi:hypothetical protein
VDNLDRVGQFPRPCLPKVSAPVALLQIVSGPGQKHHVDDVDPNVIVVRTGRVQSQNGREVNRKAENGERERHVRGGSVGGEGGFPWTMAKFRRHVGGQVGCRDRRKQTMADSATISPYYSVSTEKRRLVIAHTTKSTPKATSAVVFEEILRNSLSRAIKFAPASFSNP